MWVFSSDKNMLFSVMFGVIITEEKGFSYTIWLRCTIARSVGYPNLVFLLTYPEGLLALYT